VFITENQFAKNAKTGFGLINLKTLKSGFDLVNLKTLISGFGFIYLKTLISGFGFIYLKALLHGVPLILYPWNVLHHVFKFVFDLLNWVRYSFYFKCTV
jgi:hypothetical protein